MTPCFFELGLIGYGLELMILYKMSPGPHQNYFQQNHWKVNMAWEHLILSFNKLSTAP